MDLSHTIAQLTYLLSVSTCQVVVSIPVKPRSQNTYLDTYSDFWSYFFIFSLHLFLICVYLCDCFVLDPDFLDSESAMCYIVDFLVRTCNLEEIYPLVVM